MCLSHLDNADWKNAVGGLFGGSVAMASLSSSFMDVCRYRLCLCRDVLVALLMLRRKGGREKEVSRRGDEGSAV